MGNKYRFTRREARRNVTVHYSIILAVIVLSIFAVDYFTTISPKTSLTGYATVLGGKLQTADFKSIATKIEDDIRFDTYFTQVEKGDDELTVSFYHDSFKNEPVMVSGISDYTLSSVSARPNEIITLQVPLENGEVPRFNLQIGSASEVFEFGITIINVQSHPVVGGSWIVEFTTEGTADLKIAAWDGTEWNKDISFESLSCGSTQLQPSFDGTYYTYHDYYCSESGYFTVHVLTSGKHTQHYEFGSDVKYAFNQARAITVNVTETTINSSIGFIGTDFVANTTYTMTILLEANSSWWDGYDEQWDMPYANISTDSTGNFTFNWTVPWDFRTSEGWQRVFVGQKIHSAVYWSTQGAMWSATAAQATKNELSGDNNDTGFIFSASNAAAANAGGIEKFSKVDGSLQCKYNMSAATAFNFNDLTVSRDGTIVYTVTSNTSRNLYRINATDCTLIGTNTTRAAISYSAATSSDEELMLVTFAASSAPMLLNISIDPPRPVSAFSPAAIASIGYDGCISPDKQTIYVGYANGNVTAYNRTGGIVWNQNPHVNDTGGYYLFPIYGVACDDQRVYAARNGWTSVIAYQGFIDAMNATDGRGLWNVSKTNTVYDGANVNDIRCDSQYCYAVKSVPTITTGIAASTIWQINKTNGQVTWWNWRSWLPVTYNWSYGLGQVHSNAQSVWIDNDTNGFLFVPYTNGWVQKLAKNDVNVTEYPNAGFWIRGMTDFWKFYIDVPKNIWLSNETPYYTFKHWDKFGNPVATNETSPLSGVLIRYSMLNTFNSFTALEHPNAAPYTSLFIDPVIQTAITQANQVQMFNGTRHTSCAQARYGDPLYGWHYADRACLYEVITANNESWNIGSTINGTFITGLVYSLIKTKFWNNYSITKYYGNDNWAWAALFNTTNNQTLGFATKFGADQEDVWSDQYGRAVLFTNFGAASNYYRPQFRADLNRKTDNYIFFMPKGDGITNNQNFTWSFVDVETQKIAYPVIINISTEEIGSFTVSGLYTYTNTINFSAQEPNLFNRSNEPVEIAFNATGGVQESCNDIAVTDSSDNPIALWQADNSSLCVQNKNVSLWIMMNWTLGETKYLKIYYNGSTSLTPSGTTDLTVSIFSGNCTTGNNMTIDVNSANWYNWTRAAVSNASEITYFNFNDTNKNLWISTTHFQALYGYKSSNTTGTGAGAVADSTATAVSVASRCMVSGGNSKIFVKLNATAAIGALASRWVYSGRTVKLEYYFFADTGRVRIRTQLNESLPMLNVTVSKNWPPYYYISMNNFIPPNGTNSWLYYSGLYEQMKKPVAIYNGDMTEVNLSSGPLPLMFTIKYDAADPIPQTNGNVLRASNASSGQFWGKGCVPHKIWLYYNFPATYPLAGGGPGAYGTAAAPLYTSDFISCSKDISAQLPPMGNPGYVNIVPEMAWYEETSSNRFYDPLLVGKFYLLPNLWRPFNRESRFLAPFAPSATAYTTARISSYIIPKCPRKEDGYINYKEFLNDLPILLSNTSLKIQSTTYNISCATQIIRWVDSRGSDGMQMIFAKNLTVITGEAISPGWTYPINTYAPDKYVLRPDLELDMPFSSKVSVTAGYYGKWYFTYTPYNYVVHSFTSSGNPVYVAVNALSAMTMRYNFAPDMLYQKNVFNTVDLWNNTLQNFTQYLNPCYLSTYTSSYGLTTSVTPGWQMNIYGATAQTCPHEKYNKEIYSTFRPGFTSLFPTSALVGVQNEIFIDGRMNFGGSDLEPGFNDTYYVARHAALWDDNHTDDYNAILSNYSELTQGPKQPNKQPWYCQISYKTNRSFCVMTGSTATSILNYNPGGGLTANTLPWLPYWQSNRELSTFKDWYANRWNDSATWLLSYNSWLDITLYPVLKGNEMAQANMLMISNNPSDYTAWFEKPFPDMFDVQKESQFLLDDWANNLFVVFNRDEMIYGPGSVLNVTGMIVYNGNYLNNTGFSFNIRKNNGELINSSAMTTDHKGKFSWMDTLPTNLSANIYYVEVNVSSNGFTDNVPFRINSFNIDTTANKSHYYESENVSITHTITDVTSKAASDPASVQQEVIDSAGSTIKCSRYPATTENCINLLAKPSSGVYSDIIPLNGTVSNGDATVRITLTNTYGGSEQHYFYFWISKTNIVVAKSVELAFENQTAVKYNITVAVTNAGGRDLTNIAVADSDISLNSAMNLNSGVSYFAYGQKTITKTSQIQNYAFSRANATYTTVSGASAVVESANLSVSVEALDAISSLVLHKSTSVYLTQANNITYNVTLTLTNSGGRNATNAIISDADSPDSSYSIGTMTPAQTVTRSYLKVLNRTATATTQVLVAASANATDSIGGTIINATSDALSVAIPATSGSASLLLDKIASIWNVSNATITYNITLVLTNKGGSNTSNSNITDPETTFLVGAVEADSQITRSYLKNFTRNDTTYYSMLGVATAYGNDTFTANIISSNSSAVNVTVPSSTTAEQLTLMKNIYYNSENATVANYTVLVQVVNSGGNDLSSITLIDSDLDVTQTINLNRTQLYNYSAAILVNKAASNAEKLFTKTYATVSSVTYYSNQINIIVPGYGGPADTIVYAPASATASTSFDSIIEILNRNSDIGQDFILDYWIANNDETTIYSSGQKTIYVAASGGTNSTVTLTAPGSADTYRLIAKVSWTGGNATAYDSFTVVVPATSTTSTTSGGGGGGTLPIVKSENKSASLIKAGELATISFDKSEYIAVQSIELTTINSVSNVAFSVKVISNTVGEEPITSAEGAVYKYLEITKPLTDENIQSATIKFKVEKNWVQENSIDPNSIILNRYTNNKWSKLPTIKSSEDVSHYYYRADTPGFSVFAITGEKITFVEEGSAKIQIIDYPEFIELVINESTEKEVNVKNTGGEILHNVELTISGLPMNLYIINPKMIDIIPGETQIFRITIKPSSKEMQYPIKFTIISDEGRTERFSVLNIISKPSGDIQTVTAESQTLLLAGIAAVVLIVLIILIFLFMKKKRRRFTFIENQSIFSK